LAIATRWSVTLGREVTPAQVVLCLLDLKLARRMDKLAGVGAEVQRDHSEPVECLCKVEHGGG